MKKLCLILALIFIGAGCFSNTALASNITPYYNNTINTETVFAVMSNGEANVSVYYEGHSSITTGATVRIKIEKRNLLVFWTEVIVDIHYFREASHAETFVYQLEKSGTYRCTVEYLISGTGGADDEIVFQDTASY